MNLVLALTLALRGHAPLTLRGVIESLRLPSGNAYQCTLEPCEGDTPVAARYLLPNPWAEGVRGIATHGLRAAVLAQQQWTVLKLEDVEHVRLGLECCDIPPDEICIRRDGAGLRDARGLWPRKGTRTPLPAAPTPWRLAFYALSRAAYGTLVPPSPRAFSAPALHEHGGVSYCQGADVPAELRLAFELAHRLVARPPVPAELDAYYPEDVLRFLNTFARTARAGRLET